MKTLKYFMILSDKTEVGDDNWIYSNVSYNWLGNTLKNVCHIVTGMDFNQF